MHSSNRSVAQQAWADTDPSKLYGTELEEMQTLESSFSVDFLNKFFINTINELAKSLRLHSQGLRRYLKKLIHLDLNNQAIYKAALLDAEKLAKKHELALSMVTSPAPNFSISDLHAFFTKHAQHLKEHLSRQSILLNMQIDNLYFTYRNLTDYTTYTNALYHAEKSANSSSFITQPSEINYITVSSEAPCRLIKQKALTFLHNETKSAMQKKEIDIAFNLKALIHTLRFISHLENYEKDTIYLAPEQFSQNATDAIQINDVAALSELMQIGNKHFDDIYLYTPANMEQETPFNVEFNLKTLIHTLHFQAQLAYYPKESISLPLKQFTLEKLFDALLNRATLSELMQAGAQHLNDMKLRPASVTSHLRTASSTELGRYNQQASINTTAENPSSPNESPLPISEKYIADSSTLPNEVNEAESSKTSSDSALHSTSKETIYLSAIQSPLASNHVRARHNISLYKPFAINPLDKAVAFDNPESKLETSLDLLNKKLTQEACQTELYRLIKTALHFFLNNRKYMKDVTLFKLNRCDKHSIELSQKFALLIDIAQKRPKPKTQKRGFFSCLSPNKPSEIDAFFAALGQLNEKHINASSNHHFETTLLNINPAILYHDTLRKKANNVSYKP